MSVLLFSIETIFFAKKSQKIISPNSVLSSLCIFIRKLLMKNVLTPDKRKAHVPFLPAMQRYNNIRLTYFELKFKIAPCCLNTGQIVKCVMSCTVAIIAKQTLHMRIFYLKVFSRLRVSVFQQVRQGIALKQTCMPFKPHTHF